MKLAVNRYFIIIFTIVLEIVFIGLMNTGICIVQDLSRLKTFLSFANLIILVASVFVILAIKQVMESARSESEKNLMKSNLEQVEDLIRSLNSKHHEYNRHLQLIQAMLYLENYQEAKEYLDGVVAQSWQAHDIVYFGNPLLTVLGNSKSKVAEAKAITFDLALKCDINKLQMKPWDLCSIIGNLIDNAMEAAIQEDKDREVTVEIKYEDARFVFYVKNSGPEIPEKDRKRIFEAGYSSKDSQGSGFGLHIVKKLVESYNGTISLVSRPKTTFIVSIPDKGVIKDVKESVHEAGHGIGDALGG